MSEIYIPSGTAEAEFTEKRSRFIGQLKPTETEDAARAFLEEVRRRHFDARHNCWCWLLQDGKTRYGDDGEPQGTAGLPMLDVFTRAGVTNLCCVVTRYFGGTLLGTGGLVRAYSRAAKDALAAAGISVVRQLTRVRVHCPYPLLERLRRETELLGGVIADTQYTVDVCLNVLLPEENAEAFSARVRELTAGECRAEMLEKTLQALPTEIPLNENR